MEADKADTIGKVLDLEIDPKHVILSHTPMQELAERYRGKLRYMIRLSVLVLDLMAFCGWLQTRVCSLWARTTCTMW